MKYYLFAFLFFLALSSCNNKKNEDGRHADFIYNGEQNIPDLNFDYITMESPTLNCETIPTPECASSIAYEVICEVYGEDVANNEKPYVISLINDEYWEIHGSRSLNVKKMEGGVFHLFIRKNNAIICRIWHDK